MPCYSIKALSYCECGREPWETKNWCDYQRVLKKPEGHKSNIDRYHEAYHFTLANIDTMNYEQLTKGLTKIYEND